MATTTVTPKNNGPYHLIGEFKIVTQGGKEIQVESNQTWLCRCGQSSKKPFCDGTHAKASFQSNLDA